MQVIPERMPDCSYFLQGEPYYFVLLLNMITKCKILTDFVAGLCNNESCPYRHVNVNPNASVCEGFLRGYCADGNEVMPCYTKTQDIGFFFNIHIS